jgi:hypothetical protein
MAKLVDALPSGGSVRKDVQVRILFWALQWTNQFISVCPFLFTINFYLKNNLVRKPILKNQLLWFKLITGSFINFVFILLQIINSETSQRISFRYSAYSF